MGIDHQKALEALMKPDARKKAYDAIIYERTKQPRHEEDDLVWYRNLVSEVGELSAAVIDRELPQRRMLSMKSLIVECTQVAALCVKRIEVWVPASDPSTILDRMVEAERMHQLDRYKDQMENSMLVWLGILMAEVGELADAMIPSPPRHESLRYPGDGDDFVRAAYARGNTGKRGKNRIYEAVQVCTVAIAMAETDILRRQMTGSYLQEVDELRDGSIFNLG